MRRTFLGHAAVQLEIGEHEVPMDPFSDGEPVASTTWEGRAPSRVPLRHPHADPVGGSVARQPDAALEAVRRLDPTAGAPIHDDPFRPIHQGAGALRARVEDESEARRHVPARGAALGL
jgi:L-ascorbate metabolism protein UlaG (beta-lactamase superfamily)